MKIEVVITNDSGIRNGFCVEVSPREYTADMIRRVVGQIEDAINRHIEKLAE